MTRAPVVAALGLLLAACGGHSTTNGTASTGGDTQASGGMAAVTCEKYALSDWCNAKPCPASEGAVAIDCGMPPFRVQYHRWTTKCGGSAIVQNGGLWVQSWFFDGSGNLVGQAFTSDSGSRCALATFEYTNSAGELCELDQSGPELCQQACPNEPCAPHATITSDFPTTLADAAGMTFSVCRDTWCMGAQVPTGWTPGQQLSLEGGAGVQSATLMFIDSVTSLRVQLDWSMPNITPQPTDHYHAWLEDNLDHSRPTIELFDIPVTYNTMDLGCAGTCLVARVDVPGR